MKIIRVFARRTKASPDDEMAFYGPPPFYAEGDEVHVSISFTYDIPRGEWLAKQWGGVATVRIGGPALNEPGEEFEPGMYLKRGYVITSRGCLNRCWFCSVWKREGEKVRELKIKDGWLVQDDNLLACSEDHIRNVFNMLKKQPKRAQFTGGLEAKRLLSWHVDLLIDLKPEQIFFAYDDEYDYEPLLVAAKYLKDAGMIRPNRHTIRCYCLIGYPGDSHDKALERLNKIKALGIMPMAMLYRNQKGETDQSWRKLQRLWANPYILGARK